MYTSWTQEKPTFPSYVKKIREGVFSTERAKYGIAPKFQRGSLIEEECYLSI